MNEKKHICMYGINVCMFILDIQQQQNINSFFDFFSYVHVFHFFDSDLFI